MRGPDLFAVDPWSLPEKSLDVESLGFTESLLALSNGHIGLRGNLEEGEPAGTPGTYLNAFFETRPLPYAETGYGYPEDGQTIVNVTDGKPIRLLVDDEPFDVRYGQLLHHERTLDMRDGVLRRSVEWCSPAGQRVIVRSTRLVSFVQRSIAAISYEVEPVGEPARLVIQSELVANQSEGAATSDPRVGASLENSLIAEAHDHRDLRAVLVHRTRESELRMAAAMDHVFEGPEATATDVESGEQIARVTFSTELVPGQCLRIVKFIAYGWSGQRSLPALRDQVEAAIAAARRTGWEGLVAGQRAYLDDVWARADIELDGDPALQQAIRFALFSVVQAGARAEQRAIPAKGLTGRGYDGHTFWDSEMYTLPVLTYVLPEAGRDALAWRHSTIDLAKDRASVLTLAGAAFPWRTIRGQECSGYWPAGTAAFHVGAGIAEAVRRYVFATGDTEFERGSGVDLAVETARLWRSLGHHDHLGRFRIDGVTGPDEYGALGDNNVYTNLMAARNLRLAADFAERYGDRAAELEVDDQEVAAWRRAADAIVIPFSDELGVTEQAERFTTLRRWDFDGRDDDYPLLLHVPYLLLYSSQVCKQADLVMALYTCGDCFDSEQKARDFDYYERITVRDSSLSASIQSIVAAEIGHLDLAFAYLGETAFMDLHDLSANTRDGVHLAALGGAWLAIVAGFGGMRDHGERLAFAPRMPRQLTRIAFGIVYRGRRLRIEITPEGATYELVNGEPVELLHEDEPLTLEAGAPQQRPLAPLPERPAPPQPHGREPRRTGSLPTAPWYEAEAQGRWPAAAVAHYGAQRKN